jgi:hypothetical protein
MKKKLLIALAVSALTATSAFAALTAPGLGVLGSVHDMNSVGGGVAKDAQGRVCAFCHTPHHALDSNAPGYGDYMPLWSHTMTTQAFTQYGADSYTYDAATAGSIDPLIGPSRLCMSCHDGLIAPDQHYGGTSLTDVKFAGNEFTGADWQIGIGANGALNRTHPIGFKLADAVTADLTSNPASSGETGFNAGVGDGSAVYLGAKTATKTIASQLYNGYMTCATCHDVHNKDNATNAAAGIDGDHPDTVNRNYLVFSPQSGSQLCLSCHNK